MPEWMVNVGDALDAGNAVPLQEHSQDEFRLIDGQVHSIQRLLLRLREGFGALAALVAAKSVAVFAELAAFGTAVVASHIDLLSRPCHNRRGVQSLSRGFGLRLLPLTGANCQREESTSLQGKTPRSRNSVVHWCSRLRRVGLSIVTPRQPSKHRMQNSQRVSSWNFHPNSLQTRTYLRNRLVYVARKTKNTKTQLRKTDIGGVFLPFKDGLKGSYDLLQLKNALIKRSSFLEPLRQLLFCSRQPLTLRVFVNNHDVLRLPHANHQRNSQFVLQANPRIHMGVNHSLR